MLRAKFPQEKIEALKTEYGSDEDSASEIERHIGYDINDAIRVCKINGKISLDLINKYIEIISYKDPCGIIYTCKNKDGFFEEDYYRKLMDFLGEEKESYSNNIIRFCKTDGVLNEDLYEKGMALKQLGFTPTQVLKLMEECSKSPEHPYTTDNKFFREELYNKIENLVNQNIDKKEICDFLRTCIDSKTMEFNEDTYKILLELRNHLEEKDVTDAYNYYLKHCDNIQEAYRYIDELRSKYNVTSAEVSRLYNACCDRIDTPDDKNSSNDLFSNIFADTKARKINPLKYEKAIELITTYKIKEDTAWLILERCTVNGKFDEKLYNTFIELKTTGLSDLRKSIPLTDEDRELSNILWNSVYEENGVSGVNYEALDKLKTWFDIYIKLKFPEGKTEINKMEYSSLTSTMRSIIECFKSSDSTGVEFVEQFLKLGIVDNIDTVLKSSYTRGNDGKIDTSSFDKNILNAYLKLAEIHELSDNAMGEAVKLAKGNDEYYIHNSSEIVLSNIENINRLLKAGWNKSLNGMRNLMRNIKVEDKYFNHFDKDLVEIYEHALRNGIPDARIFDIVKYCDNNYKGEMYSYRLENFKTDNFNRTKFNDLVEILRNYDGTTSYNGLESFSQLIEYKKEILECIESGKTEVLTRYIDRIASLAKSGWLEKENIPEVLSIIKNNSKEESIDELFDRINSGLSYFNHLDDISSKDLSNAYNFYALLDTEKKEFSNVLKSLDYEGVDVKKMLKYIKCIYNHYSDRSKETHISPEVLAKMKELLKSGELDELFTQEIIIEYPDLKIIQDCAMNCGQFFAYNNPKFSEVLDALVEAKRDGLFDTKIMQDIVLKHLGRTDCKDGFYSNYQEIINFYKENKDFILSYTNEKHDGITQEGYDVLNAILGYRTNIKVEKDENGNNIMPQSIQEDVQTLSKMVKYLKLLDDTNKSVFTKIKKKKDIDLKDIINFLDKVDMDKYSKEVIDIMNRLVLKTNSYYGILDPSLTEREIEFILDVQQLINKTVDEHNAVETDGNNPDTWSPEELGGSFFGIFTHGTLSDEALNRLRFCIEVNLSLPENEGSIGKISELSAIINAYKARPDKIDEFEHYLFLDKINERSNYFSMLHQTSYDKTIANLEWILLDEILPYVQNGATITEPFNINDSQETVQAKLNVWNAIKPTDKNVSVITLNDILGTIYSITPYKQNIIIDAHKAGYSSISLKSLSNDIKETTAEKIHDLIKQNYPFEFVLIIAANSRTNVQVEYGTRLFQDGRYKYNEIGGLLSPINDETVEIAELIYFNKEEVFPSDIAKKIVNNATNENKKLICETLVKDKSFPRARISDVIFSVSNDRSFQLANKLFSDEHKEFSLDQKIEILNCTEYNNIQDLDTYIRDIYYGVERSCPIRTACAYSRYGNMIKSMEIRENIMKHSKILKQHGIESDEKAIDKMLTTQESTASGNYDGGINAYGLDGVNELLKITDMATIENATQLKFTGFKNFLLYGSLLSRLSPENHAKLKEVLAKFPYPEQKVQKIQIVTSLIGNISDADLTTLINKIESPSLTTEQKSAVERIFSPENEKPYSEKIEDFIKEFNVPATKVDNIRSWLISAKLDTKFIAPKSIDEQIKDIDRRILKNERLINSGKIPEEGIERMRASINAAKAEREDMLANPEKYTKFQINDKQMPIIESKIRDNINYPNQTKAFIEDTCKLLYAKMGIESPSKDLLDAINYDFKYFARLFAGLDNPGWHSDEGFTFRTEFTKLINLLMANPGKKLTEARMTIPENQKTKEMFIENGLDFEFWNKYDDNFKHKFSTLIKRDQAVAEVLNNLKNELETDLFKKFDEKEREQLLNKIKVAVEAIPKTDDSIENNLREANTILNVIENELKENEYWKQNAGMFSDHIKDHHKKVHDAKDIKDREVTLYVRLSDSDDIGRNIFFGDHVGCCTSTGGGNGFAAPQHLQNAFVRGYELVDEDGISYGNSMCFFAKVDGKLTFVIDSFEANGQLAASEEVPEALIKFAHMVCEREGRPDAQVMFGPNYNQITTSRFKETSGHSIEMVGVAPCDTYIDSMGGFGDINEPYETSMNEIKE
ncbi:MAG: hypothetical protein MJ237_08240 [bacterium]|nr:hypothetical protein [bacterium]